MSIIAHRGELLLPSFFSDFFVMYLHLLIISSFANMHDERDQKGYWFASDMTETDAPEFLKSFASTFETRKQKHLSPEEAVKFCVNACNSERKNETDGKGIKSLFVDAGLCKCGATPSKFLKNGLKPDDFSLAHDFMTNCITAKARQVTLMENETQPICCPPYNLLSPRPPGWKRFYFMGGDNLEGEYFEHHTLECGSFLDCEKVARMKGAELAVFDMYNSMCYLARNVIDLESAYTVTKDNSYRYYIDLRKKKTS